LKRFFPLFFLVILVVSIRVVYAETESLYVDSKTTDMQNWDERNAPSPYLADESTGFIRETKSAGATEGYFGFADPIGTDVINSVTLYFECYGDDTDDQFYVYVDCSDGSGWVNEGTIAVDQTGYGWETLSLTARLDSWPDIQNARIYLYYVAVGGGDDVYVRRAYLYVDYTPSTGTDYMMNVSQGISWAGVGYRAWDASRDFSQEVTLSSVSSREWGLTRAFTQSLTFSSGSFEDLMEYVLIQVTQSLSLAQDSFRTWDLSRAFTQGISFASSVERFAQFLRIGVQSLTALTGSFRSWTLIRSFSLPMTFSSNVAADIFKSFQIVLFLGLQLSSGNFRGWSLSRMFDLGLSFSSFVGRGWSLVRVALQSLTASVESSRVFSAIRQVSQDIVLSSGVERFVSFARGVSQPITMTLVSLRSWDLSRSFTQGVSFVSNVFRKLTEYAPPPKGTEAFFRSVSVGLEFASSHIRNWSLTRKFNQGLTFVSNATAFKFIAQFYHRFVSLSMSFTSNVFAHQFIGQLITILVSLNLNLSSLIAVTLNVIEEFDALLIPNLFAMIFTVGYFLVDDEKKTYFGGFAFILWFFSAGAELASAVVNYELAFLYGAFATIMIILILMDRAKDFGMTDFWKS